MIKQTHRHTDILTDRQTDRQTDRPLKYCIIEVQSTSDMTTMILVEVRMSVVHMMTAIDHTLHLIVIRNALRIPFDHNLQYDLY